MTRFILIQVRPGYFRIQACFIADGVIDRYMLPAIEVPHIAPYWELI